MLVSGEVSPPRQGPWALWPPGGSWMIRPNLYSPAWSLTPPGVLFLWPRMVLRLFSLQPPAGFSSNAPSYFLLQTELGCPLHSQPHGCGIPPCGTGLSKDTELPQDTSLSLMDIVCLCMHPTCRPPRAQRYLCLTANAGWFERTGNGKNHTPSPCTSSACHD